MASDDVFQPKTNMVRIPPRRSVTVLAVIGLVGFQPASLQENVQFVQADIYNALYEAHVQCDDRIELSRSEFITDMFDRYQSNVVTVELLRTLIGHNIEIAQKAVSDFEGNQLSENAITTPDSVEICVARQGGGTGRESQLVSSDSYLDDKNHYIEVHECVLRVL